MDAVVAAVAFAVVVIVAAFGPVAVRRWVWRPVVAQRVIVQLDSDHAVSGVLVERRGPLLIIADAHVHTHGGQQVKADGRSVIERSRVLWVQVI